MAVNSNQTDWTAKKAKKEKMKSVSDKKETIRPGDSP